VRTARRSRQPQGAQINPGSGVMVSVISFSLLEPTIHPAVPLMSLFTFGFTHSMIHRNALERLGIVPMEVPPEPLIYVFTPFGMIRPRYYTPLLVQQDRLQLSANINDIFVLDDTPYREIDIYFGTPVLDDHLGGNLPECGLVYHVPGDLRPSHYTGRATQGGGNAGMGSESLSENGSYPQPWSKLRTLLLLSSPKPMHMRE
jgi:hypothetical protein